jgi:cell division protein FtsW
MLGTPTIAQKKSPGSAGSDRFVLLTIGILAAAGIVAVYSAITFFAETRADQTPSSFLFRHLLRTALAIGAMIVFSRIEYRKLVRWGAGAILGSLALLLIVQINGVVSGGAARWLRIGGFTIQPSDIARVALVIHLAYLLAKKQLYIDSLSRAFVPLLVWTVPTILLIGMEDLSTAALVFCTAMVMCFVGRVRILHLATLSLALLVCATIFLASSPGRAARIESWVGNTITSAETAPANDLQGEGYQAHQAKIAFAMGGLTGRGPGKSIQRDFLPAPYNDFIVAIVAEEYGTVGVILLLFLFCVLLFRGFLRIARSAEDPLGLFLAVGATSMIVLYGFINAGVACGLLPVTGLPMPFVSYGGTSLLANGVLVGILLNVSRHCE